MAVLDPLIGMELVELGQRTNRFLSAEHVFVLMSYCWVRLRF